ncbi:MAG: hypothetical protein U0836_17915 [Pirellulales bacterium]
MTALLELPGTPVAVLDVKPQRWFRLLMLLIRDPGCADDDEVKGIEIIQVHRKIPERTARRWVSANNINPRNGVICVAREVDEDGELAGTFAFEPDRSRRGGVIEQTDESFLCALRHEDAEAEGGAE